MLVTADDVGRSLRGTMALLNRRADALAAFDVSEAGFWRSFGAIWLTLPAFVVMVAAERARLGILEPGSPIIDLSWVTVMAALQHVATFLALPLAMIAIAPRLGLGARYVPFVVVMNWVTATAHLILAVPSLLMLVGWATPELATLFTFAFGVIVVHVYWFATKTALGVSGGLAGAAVAAGLLAAFVVGTTLASLIAPSAVEVAMASV